MSQNAAVSIPTPVGGIPIGVDAVPSIVFATLYGLLFPFIVHRWVSPGRRSMLLINVTLVSVERVVVYSLRARQALNEDLRDNWGLLKYLQLSFAQGFVQMIQDVVPLFRVLVVNASGGPHHLEPSRYRRDDGPKEDRPKLRMLVRAPSDMFNFAWMGSTIPGLVGFLNYGTAITNASKADRLFILRYISTGVALALVLFCMAVVAFTMFNLRYVNKGGCVRLLALLSFSVIVCVYRLIFMKNRIPELLFTGPGSLQSTSAKATFYIFHCLPEWLASALLIVPNTRNYFQTGPWGDWQLYDGQKGCREARTESKEAMAKWRRERAEKKAATAAPVVPAGNSEAYEMA